MPKVVSKVVAKVVVTVARSLAQFPFLLWTEQVHPSPFSFASKHRPSLFRQPKLNT
jgi:hypothetical protein